MPSKHKSSYILEVKIVIFLQDVTYKAFLSISCHWSFSISPWKPQKISGVLMLWSIPGVYPRTLSDLCFYIQSWVSVTNGHKTTLKMQLGVQLVGSSFLSFAWCPKMLKQPFYGMIWGLISLYILWCFEFKSFFFSIEYKSSVQFYRLMEIV